MNEDYTEWVEENKKRDSPLSRLSRQIKPWHIIIVGFILFLGNYLNKTGQVKSQWFWGFIIILGVVVVYLLYRDIGEKKLIPEHIIKDIAQASLERKRLKGVEIPFDSKVHVTLVGEPVYETDLATGGHGIIKREVGFEVIKKGYRRTGVIGVQPYTGDIMGIRWERTGYTGKETKDRVIVPVLVNNTESRYENTKYM
jgi:hypothetical protein